MDCHRQCTCRRDWTDHHRKSKFRFFLFSLQGKMKHSRVMELSEDFWMPIPLDLGQHHVSQPLPGPPGSSCQLRHLLWNGNIEVFCMHCGPWHQFAHSCLHHKKLQSRCIHPSEHGCGKPYRVHCGFLHWLLCLRIQIFHLWTTTHARLKVFW